MKATLNRVLRATTGYEFRRCTEQSPLLGFSATDLEIVHLVVDRTMTSPVRLLNAMSAARYVAGNNIPGAIVECGVWRAGTSMAMASALVQLNVCDLDLYLFDTFTGMTAPTSEDFRLLDGKAANRLEWSAQEYVLTGEQYHAGVAAFSSREDVLAGMKLTGYPMNRVHLVEGDVLETFTDHAPDEIAVLRLDTDWYESTLHELKVGWPRVTHGGVVIIDDYDYWAGARRAADEFFSSLSFQPLLARMDEGRLAVKLTR